jgi:hypothetical protein
LDKTNWLNIFSFHKRKFFGLHIGQAQPSAWVDYPKFFKFVSFAVYLSPDLNQYNRITYDFLNLLRDLGGLYTGLFALLYGGFSGFAKYNTGVTVKRSLFM